MMNPNDPDLDPFTEALRQDLPSGRDDARVRARLVSAGMLAGAGALAPGAAAATAGGLLAKLGGLPIAAKIGASALVVGVAALPVIESVRGGADADAARPRAAAGTAQARPARAPERTTAGATMLEAVPEAPVVPAAPPRPAGRAARAPAPEATSARAEMPPGPARAAAAFSVEEPIDEGTLRAETALLERALAAIRSGDLGTARRELAAHAAQFPNGHLKPERERALERALGKETER